MIKLVYIVRKRDDIAFKDFSAYWLEKHGPLVRSFAKAIRARKYVQSHLIDSPANRGMQEARGMMEGAAGITEVWWDSLADLEAAFRDPAGVAATQDLANDEAKFIDIGRSQLFVTQEHTIFDYTAGAR